MAPPRALAATLVSLPAAAMAARLAATAHVAAPAAHALNLKVTPAGYLNEYVTPPGHTVKSVATSPAPADYTLAGDLPDSFSWANVSGVSYLTKSLNQHIPQYCGSCWAHGAASALADRVKIARGAAGVDVNLAIQFILNCGTEVAGSCHGGSHSGTYEFVHSVGHWPYDTCQQYAACSAESKEGLCPHGDFTCSPQNVCRTCSTFSDMGGFCTELDYFPNVTIAEYGEVKGEHAMKAEIFRRGPIACVVDADPLHEYTGGIMDPESWGMSNHIVSVVGWGVDPKDGGSYWIVRNSWGEYWGEMGYYRQKAGKNQLQLESDCAWAVPKTWSEHNLPCYEDGTNCDHGAHKPPSFTAYAQAN